MRFTDEGYSRNALSAGLAIVKTKNTHNHEADDHKVETRQLRVRVRHNSGDISQRPSKVVRSELQKMEESLLNLKDLKNVGMSMYSERRKQFPKLPKSRTEIHDV
jgi:3-isopropylmalate dehydratase small subunit